MSASERLRALRQEWEEATPLLSVTGAGKYAHECYKALPLIADTLEKAEEMSDWLEIQSSNGYGRDLIPIREFDAALTALNDALQEDVNTVGGGQIGCG